MIPLWLVVAAADETIGCKARNARRSGDHDTTRQPKKRAQRLGPAATPGEAALNLVRQKKFSRKLNYTNIAALLDVEDIEEPKLRRLSSVSVQPDGRGAGAEGGEKSDTEKTDGDKTDGEKTDGDEKDGDDLGEDKSDEEGESGARRRGRVPQLMV